MAKQLLPIFPKDATPINGVLSFSRWEGRVWYFHGCLPVFSHGEEDVKTFRMYTSQLVVDGNCSQMEIVRAFGVSEISVKRWVKRYREEGPKGFYRSPA